MQKYPDHINMVTYRTYRKCGYGHDAANRIINDWYKTEQDAEKALLKPDICFGCGADRNDYRGLCNCNED